MKKSIKLRDLDCANCAAKIESAASKLDGVKNVSVNFMAQRMVLEADDDKFAHLLEEIKKLAKKIERDIVFLD